MGKPESLSFLVTSKTRKKKIENRNELTRYELTGLEIRDRALYLAGNLASVDPPNDMTGYYCKAFRMLGESRYSAVVTACNQPGIRAPSHLFGYLLKEEMKSHMRRSASI